MNISNYGLYLSIWADNTKEAKSLNVRLLNGVKANWRKYVSKDGASKFYCTIKSALVNLGNADFYVSAKNNSWFLAPANKPATTAKKATIKKSSAKRVTKKAVAQATNNDDYIEL